MRNMKKMIDEVICLNRPLHAVASQYHVDTKELSRLVMDARREKRIPIKEILKTYGEILSNPFPSLSKVVSKTNINISDVFWTLRRFSANKTIKISIRELQQLNQLYKTMSHYVSDDKEPPKDVFLDQKQEEDRFYVNGYYSKWTYEILPIKLINHRVIRDNGYVTVVHGIKNCEWIPPIKVYSASLGRNDKRFVTIDGAHRITASLDCGYTKVPSFVLWKLTEWDHRSLEYRKRALSSFKIDKILEVHRKKLLTEVNL